MAEYKTPGVYVEEIPTFPASVVRVATAVPVFIGYTELHPAGYENVPTKIRSLIEYERLFGGEPPSSDDGRDLIVTLDAGNGYAISSVTVSLKYYLYHSLRLFYANGGGDAYIMSIGDYSAGEPDVTDFTDLLPIHIFTELEKVDEPTLLLAPDAWSFTDPADLGDVQKLMLAHCAKMQDRFAILDVVHDGGGNGADDDSSDFRDYIGTQNLKYGAAYYPELLSSLGPNGPIELDSFDMVNLLNNPVTLNTLGTALNDASIIGYFAANADLANIPNDGVYLGYKTVYDGLTSPATDLGELKDLMDGIKTVVDVVYGYRYPAFVHTNLAVKDLVTRLVEGPTSPLALLVQKMLDYDARYDAITPAGLPLGSVTGAYGAYGLTPSLIVPAIYGPGPLYTEPTAPTAATDDFDALFDEAYGYLGQIRDLVKTIATGDDLFVTSRKLAEIRDAIRNTGYTLPPCGAIAGIYAVNDASNGVWHAPANMSLNAVRDVARKMQALELDDLNIPGAGNGKSINAIRSFQGKGILVYGARTLAGNDNEWRYVPVRRLFNMVEESVKKATEPFVFEPNDANTWIKVKGMIENFLLGLWNDGALAGAVPKDAFFVKVGIGQTMTAQDILEGRLIVEIGMAAVRPAEFVILKFMHKMQES